MIVEPQKHIARNFDEVAKASLYHEYTEYLLGGGRGSTKSSFISIMIPLLQMLNPNVHALVLRKYQNTLRDSVYEQMQWGIFEQDLEQNYKFTKTPLQIENVRTGQKIMFRGCDDPTKIKSIKVKTGYIGILWFEEFSEFTPEEVRSIKQSILRGGNKFWIFESYNPPVSAKNWVNEYALTTDPMRLTHFSDYRTVPVEWLGDIFFYEAEKVKKWNERVYNHEYLGIATGTGLNIFENIIAREITDEEYNSQEWYYRGIDWGYFPDPFCYGEMAYDAKRKRLYIWKEVYLLKHSNQLASDTLIEQGVDPTEFVTADSAETKSIQDFREYGWNIKGAIKGQGSVASGFKWLQSLNEIVIDPRRTPKALKEFTGYEYNRDRNGEVLSGYPEGQEDHFMALTRYALEKVWRKRGM